MKQKLFVFMSLILVASMILSACSSVKPTETQPVQPTTVAAEATQVGQPATEATQPAAGEAATAEPTQAAVKSDRKGGWLDKIVFSAIPEVGAAVAQLQAGSIDMYADSADDSAVFDKVKSDTSLNHALIYGSSVQLLFNTEVCKDTAVLNPFSDAKIREAMNWAFDRNYVSQEIMNGLAKPRYTALTTAFPDYSRYSDVLSAIETKYAYNIEHAKQVVDEEMPKLGATKGTDGKWQFNSKPVVIIGLIRTEDKRKEIGNYFANQLETLGFTVDRQEKDTKEAGPIWQRGDPNECKFTYYTAGWGAQQIGVDEGNMFIQYNTGQMQNLPLFAAYKPSAKLLEDATKLFTNNFKSMDERAQLFKEALNLSMEESWWGLWVTDNIAYTPYRGVVEGASDLASGFASSSLYPYTLRFTGKEGGEMKIAQPSIMVQPWNPLAGSNWTSDGMILKATMDWGTVSNPYTGIYMPKLVTKADLVVEDGLPVRKSSDWVNLSFEKEIKVPADAWADWDAVNQKFITVGEKYPNGITAKTKSVAYYTPELWKTTWHDGSNMSVADFVMNMIMTFEPGKKDSKLYDESLAPSVETYLTHFKGVKIVSTDPLVIETYDDQFGLDAENTVTTWYPSQYLPTTSTNGSMAWHAITPAIMGETNGEIAFSTDKATANKVEWTSLLAGPSLDVQAKYLDQAIADKYIPFAPTMSQYVKPEEAVARYENLKKWYEAKKHFVIGTGPYYVDQVFPVEGTITVSRYDKYLFPADQWTGFGEPRMVTAAVEGPTSVVSGEEATFDVTISFKDQPYPTSDLEKVSFLVFNAKNEMVGSGEATAVADGQYQVVLGKDVTSKLDAGSAKVSIAVASKVVSIPAFASTEFVVTK